MKSQWFRYAVVAAFACVLGALAHASISRAMHTQGPERSPENLALDQEFPGLETRLTSQRTKNESSQTKKLENTLLQKLWDVIAAAEDLSSNDKSEARAILEEADPVLARIKKDNQRAIQILRNPPRRVAPPRPAPPTTNEQSQPSPESAPRGEEGAS